MVPLWILAVGVVVLVVGASRIFHEGIVNGSVTPIVWWHVDDFQVNTKEWVSFEDRATHEPNEPYLRLCLRKAQKALSTDFKVEPVMGRAAAIQRLKEAGCLIPDGAERCPPALWMAWVRCAMLAHLGGLWLDGSVLVIGKAWEFLQRIIPNTVLSFGTDPEEASSSPYAPPGHSAGWAAMPGHSMWMGLTRDIGAIIQSGDQSWSSFEARRALNQLWEKHNTGRIDREAEVSRSIYGKHLNYEDLFDTSDWPTGVTKGLWVPLPDGRDKLNTASAFLWFTRLSEEQIQESKFLWARLSK